jgi:hypothetical protein
MALYPNKDAAILDGLIHYWPLEEKYGRDGYDMIGSWDLVHQGMDVPILRKVPGFSGLAFKNYLEEYPHHNATVSISTGVAKINYTLLPDWSFIVRYKIVGVGWPILATYYSTNRNFITVGGSWPSIGQSVAVSFNGPEIAPHSIMRIRIGDFGTFFTFSHPVDNLWHTLVVTGNSSSFTTRVYVDGALKLTTSEYVQLDRNTLNLIGSEFGTTFEVDDIGIWSRVLPQSEVSELNDKPLLNNNPDLSIKPLADIEPFHFSIDSSTFRAGNYFIRPASSLDSVGIYRSLDLENWEFFPFPPLQPIIDHNIKNYPEYFHSGCYQNNTIILLGWHTYCVYFSKDNGLTWNYRTYEDLGLNLISDENFIIDPRFHNVREISGKLIFQWSFLDTSGDWVSRTRFAMLSDIETDVVTSNAKTIGGNAGGILRLEVATNGSTILLCSSENFHRASMNFENVENIPEFEDKFIFNLIYSRKLKQFIIFGANEADYDLGYYGYYGHFTARSVDGVIWEIFNQSGIDRFETAITGSEYSKLLELPKIIVLYTSGSSNYGAYSHPTRGNQVRTSLDGINFNFIGSTVDKLTTADIFSDYQLNTFILNQYIDTENSYHFKVSSIFDYEPEESSETTKTGMIRATIIDSLENTIFSDLTINIVTSGSSTLNSNKLAYDTSFIKDDDTLGAFKWTLQGPTSFQENFGFIDDLSFELINHFFVNVNENLLFIDSDNTIYIPGEYQNETDENLGLVEDFELDHQVALYSLNEETFNFSENLHFFKIPQPMESFSFTEQLLLDTINNQPLEQISLNETVLLSTISINSSEVLNLNEIITAIK